MKQFYATISMLPEAQLKELVYTEDSTGRNDFMVTSFPSIVMLEMNLKKGDDYELYVIWTEDDNKRFRHCRERFGKELDKLSEKLGFRIEITKELGIPHDESRDKHIGFFREMCATFKPNSDVYMDVTYGSKATSISCFSSLSYAENVMNCDIKQIVYGKYNHGDVPYGTFYDIRCLYELSGLIRNASAINGLNVDKMLDMFGGDSNG